MFGSSRWLHRLLCAGSAGALVFGVTAAAFASTAQAAPAKPGVVREGNTWLLRSSLSGGPATTTFTYGSITDEIHVMGDWDGNGTKTPGVIRIQGNFETSQYIWYLRNSNTTGPADLVFAYGKPSFGFEEPGDVPVVGDWNGDGRDTAGVVRTRNGQTNALWLLRNGVGGGNADVQFSYGLISDGPFLAGDWDGNGTDTPGVIRGTGGGGGLAWLLRNSNSGGPANVQLAYGHDGDTPVVGDWNGDRSYGVGVVRPGPTSGGNWLLRNTLSSGAAQIDFTYGASFDRPVVWE
jgi:hypothetical protein